MSSLLSFDASEVASFAAGKGYGECLHAATVAERSGDYRAAHVAAMAAALVAPTDSLMDSAIALASRLLDSLACALRGAIEPLPAPKVKIGAGVPVYRQNRDGSWSGAWYGQADPTDSWVRV